MTHECAFNNDCEQTIILLIYYPPNFQLLPHINAFQTHYSSTFIETTQGFRSLLQTSPYNLKDKNFHLGTSDSIYMTRARSTLGNRLATK